MQKILIVDDDAEMRETLAGLLERERFVAMQAGDGQSGLEGYCFWKWGPTIT